MNKLEIDNTGIIKYNDNLIENNKIDTDFLLIIFENMLEEKIKIDVDDSNQLSQLFKKMQEETKNGSEFKSFWDNQMKNLTELQCKLDELSKDDTNLK